MRADLEKRLRELEKQSEPEEQLVLLYQRNGESKEDMTARLERWKQGEEVEDIKEPYRGGVLRVYYVMFVGKQDES